MKHLRQIIFVLYFMGSETISGIKASANDDKVEIRKVTAILDWEGLSPSEISDDAKYKLAKMLASTYLPSTWPSNIPSDSDITTQIGKVDAAILKKLAGGKGTTKILNKAIKDLQNMFTEAMTMVQISMNKNPGEAEIVCIDCGFNYKSQAVRGPRKNRARRGTTPGTMEVEAEGRGMHQWEQSTDNGQTSVKLDPTSSGLLTVTGLVTDKRYWFRNRTVLTKGKYGAWSGWYSETAP